MNHLIILFIALTTCICTPSNAQNIEDDTASNQIYFKHSWGDDCEEDSKDLMAIPRAYNVRNSLIIYQDCLSQYDELYIISQSGKTMLHKTLSCSTPQKYAISLQGYRPGTYTLYLYEGNHFWYGSFTIER